MSRAVGIIPARWQSTRFPGKPLHLIANKPLLRHVWEQCLSAKKLCEVITAAGKGDCRSPGQRALLLALRHPLPSQSLTSNKVFAAPRHLRFSSRGTPRFREVETDAVGARGVPRAIARP